MVCTKDRGEVWVGWVSVRSSALTQEAQLRDPSMLDHARTTLGSTIKPHQRPLTALVS
jgi:hypothetical protein